MVTKMIESKIIAEELLPHEISRGSLYQATVTQLRKNANLSKVHRDLEILPYSWLHNLSHGKVSNADVTRMQILYSYLTGDKL